MEIDYVVDALRKLNMGNKTVVFEEAITCDTGDEYGRTVEQIEDWSLDWVTQKNEIQEIAIRSENPEQNFLRMKIVMLVLKEMTKEPFVTEKRNSDANVEKYEKITVQELDVRMKKGEYLCRTREEIGRIIEATEELMKHRAGGMEVVTRSTKRPGKKNREEMEQVKDVRLRKKKTEEKVSCKKAKTMTGEELEQYLQNLFDNE